jgi:Na+-driven multidrug efflux pump
MVCFCLKSGWSFNSLHNWREYLRLALPGTGMLFFAWSNFEIGVIAAGYLGKVDISVMSIGIQTIYMLFMIPFGIATSTNIRVGQLLGNNQAAEAKNSCKVAATLNGESLTISKSNFSDKTIR